MADGDVRSPEPWPPGRVLVVVATYKEEATIAALMAGVLGVAADLHLLVVDDESPDGTPQLALAAAAAEPRVHVLVRRGRRRWNRPCPPAAGVHPPPLRRGTPTASGGNRPTDPLATRRSRPTQPRRRGRGRFPSSTGCAAWRRW